MEYYGEPKTQYNLRITSKAIDESFGSNLFGYSFNLHINEKTYFEQSQNYYYFNIPASFRECRLGEITIYNSLM